MTDEGTHAVAERDDSSVPQALPDDRNPAIIDARKTFIITVVGAVLFIGSVIFFVL